MESTGRLSGKRALVTGATGDIGLAIAKRLAEEGAFVWLAGRNAERLAEALDCLGGTGATIAFDLQDDAACAAAIAKLADDGLDILVNNAGERDRRSIEELRREDMSRLMETNLVAPFDLARRVVPLMRRRQFGRIINITSIAAEIARGDAAYTASKAALAGLTRALAAELGAEGITVNSVAPGFVLTKSNEAWFTQGPEISDHLVRRTSLGRWATPDEIAGPVAFLASPDASYITGHALVVDGGYITHF